jgi:hypothetical protein
MIGSYHALRHWGRKEVLVNVKLWIGVSSSQARTFSADSVLYCAPTYPLHAHEPVVVSGKSEREKGRNIRQSGQERSKKPVPGKSYYCIVGCTLSTLSLSSSFTPFRSVSCLVWYGRAPTTVFYGLFTEGMFYRYAWYMVCTNMVCRWKHFNHFFLLT